LPIKNCKLPIAIVIPKRNLKFALINLSMSKPLSVETKLIRGTHTSGQGAVVDPITLSTTFLRGEDGQFIADGDIYARASNPNRTTLESKLALLENAKEAISFGSGQAATTSVFLALGSASHVIIPDDIYYGTRVLIESVFADWGLTYTIIDFSDLKNLETAIQPNTKLIWIESPSNPALKITDIEAVVKIAKAKNILTACDNTWSTPYFTQPLSLGIDIVMHSTTKYLGGHSDILGGVLMWTENLDQKIAEKLKSIQKLGGAVPSPFDSWLLNRSLNTFWLRMPKHAENAMELAQFLETHPEIEAIYYPGLSSHPGHEIAKRQMKNGFGGMLSVLIKGDEANAIKVATKLKIFRNATSLGGVESLVDHRKTAEGEHSTSKPNLLRISVGIENVIDLIDDFKQALDK
jgi:cystathionine gamma-synthase